MTGPGSDLTYMPANDSLWSEAHLEGVPVCPACGSGKRAVFYHDLRDHTFATPGEWTLQRCTDCGSAYLDPRPNRESIGMAYLDYYTHESSAEPPEGPATGALQRFKLALRNGYLRARYRLRVPPGFGFARWLVPLFFPYRRGAFDKRVRHLVLPDGPARLLDIGCGNGEFVRLAADHGWDAAGIEPDPKAVAAGREAGLPIEQGGFPRTRFDDRSFQAVTLSHVMEHLHDPIDALKEVHRILQTGGKIWIATPNFRSPLHRAFGRAWRGLEPPRHLVIFNRRSLGQALRKAGFSEVRFEGGYPTTRWLFAASQEIRARTESRPVPAVSRWAALRLSLLEAAALFDPRFNEEILVTAVKA